MPLHEIISHTELPNDIMLHNCILALVLGSTDTYKQTQSKRDEQISFQVGEIYHRVKRMKRMEYARISHLHYHLNDLGLIILVVCVCVRIVFVLLKRFFFFV